MKLSKIYLFLFLIYFIFLPVNLLATDLSKQDKKITTLSKQVYKLPYKIATKGILSKEAKQLTKLVERIESYLKTALKSLTTPSITYINTMKSKIKHFIQILNLIDRDVQAKFKEIEKILSTKGFSQEAFTRHNEYVKKYNTKLSKLKDYLTKFYEQRTTNYKQQITELLEYIEKELKVDNEYRPGPPPKLPDRRLPPKKHEYIPIEDKYPTGRLYTQDELKKAKRQFLDGIKTIPELTIPKEDDYLQETPDIQFTQEIRDLAASLDHNPVKIYEWVRNNIDFVPYWGSFKGSQGTLIERSGNSFDISSLLMALLRVSNIPCQYARAIVRMDIERAMNWLGAECPEAAADILWFGYIPDIALLVNDNYEVCGIQLHHVFVLAYVPYGYYRGWSVDESEKTWIPLDASFKQYDYIEGSSLAREVNFDFEEYYAGTQSLSPVEYYKELIEDAGISLDQVRRSRKIRQEKVWYLPANMPYKYGIKPYTNIHLLPELYDKYRYIMLLDAGAGTFFASSTVEFYGKRLTICYEPVKDIDKELINAGLIGLAY